jgi:Na+-translocating ferredoxin:NAD+ oxidoreductase subunit G
MFKNIISYAFFIGLVSAFSASIVTFAKDTTTPIIEERAKVALDEAMDTLSLYYEITSYEEMELSSLDPGLVNLYELLLDDGSIKYIYNIANNGKNGLIKFLLSYSDTGDVENIIYISHKETPGRGDKIEKNPFLGNLLGQNMNSIEIDTISGATLSSTAVKNGVISSSSHLKNEVIK